MPKQVEVTFRDNQLCLAGELDFSNVMAVHEKSLSELKNCPELHIDFSNLRSSDSSGLALLIEWVKWAERYHKKIHFRHLSDDLMSLARVAGLSSLINVDVTQFSESK